MSFLVSLSPSLMHREYRVDDALIIGRDASLCDVVVTEPTVSHRHFKISCPDGKEYVLQDLNSLNGVFVNGARIEGETVLAEGDKIGLGSVHLQHFRFQRETSRGQPWSVELPARSSWRIGRDRQNEISLPFDSTVSSTHAVVRPRGAKLEIIDRGSLNGTWLNGSRARKAEIDPTDSVMIGSTLLRFRRLEDGGLHVLRRDCHDQIAVDAIGLTRWVNRGGRGDGERKKIILDHVHLAIQPGEFVGLLGPSGAGKSTFLKALIGYQPPNYGCVLLNETPLFRSYDMFRTLIGYVPQDDIVHVELTVEDSIEYVARLRLPPDVDIEQRRGLVDSTIETLGLTAVRKNRVAQLSGGQRKRVSIGCELITRPSILFLDEPTSGMDPSTEEGLMRHFQNMARRGTTILITTHVLYSLDLLDRIAIVARGKLVFFGTPGEAMQFFKLDGKPIERPTQIFDALEGRHGAAADGSDLPGPDKIAASYERDYRNSPLFERHIKSCYSETGREIFSVAVREQGDRPDSSGPSETPAPSESSIPHYRRLLNRPRGRRRRGLRLPSEVFSLRQFQTLARRHFAIKLVSLRRVLFYLAVPLILALVTLTLPTKGMPDEDEMLEKREAIESQINDPRQPGFDQAIKRLFPSSSNEETDERSASGIVYSLNYEGPANVPVPLSVLLMFVMTAVFSGTLMSCLELSSERAVYLRERMANQKIANYLLSKLPFLLLITSLQCAVFLALCRLKPDLRHFDLLAVFVAMLAMAWVSCALGLFLSAIDPTSGQFSVILAIVVVLPQLVFSGGLGPQFYKGMADSMKILAGALPARWGLEMLMVGFYSFPPERESLAWLEEFVVEQIGFDFGLTVYLGCLGALAMQGIGWLVLSGFALKALDRTG